MKGGHEYAWKCELLNNAWRPNGIPYGIMPGSLTILVSMT